MHIQIVVVDPTKEWTFSFAKDIIENAPKGAEVLLIANHRYILFMQEHVILTHIYILIHTYIYKYIYTYINT